MRAISSSTYAVLVVALIALMVTYVTSLLSFHISTVINSSNRVSYGSPDALLLSAMMSGRVIDSNVSLNVLTLDHELVAWLSNDNMYVYVNHSKSLYRNLIEYMNTILRENCGNNVGILIKNVSVIIRKGGLLGSDVSGISGVIAADFNVSTSLVERAGLSSIKIRVDMTSNGTQSVSLDPQLFAAVFDARLNYNYTIHIYQLNKTMVYVPSRISSANCTAHIKAIGSNTPSGEEYPGLVEVNSIGNGKVHIRVTVRLEGLIDKYNYLYVKVVCATRDGSIVPMLGLLKFSGSG